MDITVQAQKWIDKSKPKEPTFVLMYLETLRGQQPTILWKGKFVNPHSSGSCFYYILKCLIIRKTL